MMGEVLGPQRDQDWSVVAGTLNWSCRETLTHIGHQLLAYTVQVDGRAQDTRLPLDLVIRDEAAVSEVLAVVEACGRLLVAALRAAGPDPRAWHFGSCDVSGFAALGVAEILIHTYDIAQGLNLNWRPPAKLSAAVLARLAPDASTAHGHVTQVLLRHTGRLGEARVWRWHITPEERDAPPEGDRRVGSRHAFSGADSQPRDHLARTHTPMESHPVGHRPVWRGPHDDPSIPDDELIRRREEWFDRYVSLKNVYAPASDVPYTCPCCGHATLSERGHQQICDECWWEDDGQDNHDSAVTRGGPNGNLSLDGARAQYVREGRVPQTHVPPCEPR
jgi:hypothetical protein